ncbi:uroporphyrinogen decarboxylase family protein [Planctomycetota bacterium]
MLTHRERFFKAVNHETPDRPPLSGGFRPEIRQTLLDHFDCDWQSVTEKLGLQQNGGAGFGIDRSEFYERDDVVVLEGEHPYAGSRMILHEDGTFTDPWGITWAVGSNGKYNEHIRGPLQEATCVTDLEKYAWPEPEDVINPENAAENVAQAIADGLPTVAGTSNPYKIAWQLRGMENCLCDYLINPDILNFVYDKLYAVVKQQAVYAAQAGIDMFTLTGDVAMQDRMIMSADKWREFDKPRLAAVIEAARAVKPDMLFFFHTDGNHTEIIPDQIEIGFNVLDPMQPECMDLDDIKKRWGDQITMRGTIGNQSTLPFGTVQDVVDKVKHNIDVLGANGGLILGPSNMVSFDVPVENIVALYETALTYRQ